MLHAVHSSVWPAGAAAPLPCPACLSTSNATLACSAAPAGYNENQRQTVKLREKMLHLMYVDIAMASSILRASSRT